jgi:hypothetical protein
VGLLVARSATNVGRQSMELLAAGSATNVGRQSMELSVAQSATNFGQKKSRRALLLCGSLLLGVGD